MGNNWYEAKYIPQLYRGHDAVSARCTRYRDLPPAQPLSASICYLLLALISICTKVLYICTMYGVNQYSPSGIEWTGLYMIERLISPESSKFPSIQLLPWDLQHKNYWNALRMLTSTGYISLWNYASGKPSIGVRQVSKPSFILPPMITSFPGYPISPLSSSG